MGVIGEGTGEQVRLRISGEAPRLPSVPGLPDEAGRAIGIGFDGETTFGAAEGGTASLIFNGSAITVTRCPNRTVSVPIASPELLSGTPIAAHSSTPACAATTPSTSFG